MLESAKASLGFGKDALVKKIANEVLQVVAVAGSAFGIELTMWLLRTIISQKDGIRRDVEKLLQVPLLTALERLNVALMLEAPVESPDAANYRILRYRDALISFDQAIVIADDNDKVAIHLFRGITAMRIPGGAKEADHDLQVYKQHCERQVEEYLRNARDREQKALAADMNAARIEVPKGMGDLEQLGYQLDAKRYRKAAAELIERADQLRLAMDTIDALRATLADR